MVFTETTRQCESWQVRSDFFKDCVTMSWIETTFEMLKIFWETKIVRIWERRIFSFADTKRLFYVKNYVKIVIKILQNEHFSLIFFLVISRRGYRASYQGNFMIHIQNLFPNNLLPLFGGILNYRHIKITVRIRRTNRNLIKNSLSPLNNI